MFQRVTTVTVKKETVVFRVLSEATGITESKSVNLVPPEPPLPQQHRVPVVCILPCFAPTHIDNNIDEKLIDP